MTKGKLVVAVLGLATLTGCVCSQDSYEKGIFSEYTSSLKNYAELDRKVGKLDPRKMNETEIELSQERDIAYKKVQELRLTHPKLK